MVGFKRAFCLIIVISVGVGAFIYSTHIFDEKNELSLSSSLSNLNTPSNNQAEYLIAACSLTYSVFFKIGDSDEIKGNLVVRRFPLDTDVIIQFINSENGASSPPAIIETKQNLYSGIKVSNSVDSASISGLIQLYALIQWSNGIAKTTEQDNNGLMEVTYNSDYSSKSKSGYQNTTNKITINGNSSAIKNDNGCFHKTIEGEDIYTIKHPIDKKDYRYTSSYKYHLVKESITDLPGWMKKNKQAINDYVLNFQMKIVENTEKPTLKNLNEALKKNNRGELKSAILLALKDEEFVTNFLSKILSDPNSLNKELSIDIIMYMSHADSELTQRAILTLLKNTEILPLDYALQAAITLGEFSDIKAPSYMFVALDLFKNTDQNEVIRSAIISSLGRMANKIQTTDPSVSDEITSSLTSKLSEASANTTDSIYLLDALSNVTSNSEEVLDVTKSYLKEDSSPLFKRAVQVYMKNGGQGYLDDVLRTTEDTGKQTILITA